MAEKKQSIGALWSRNGQNGEFLSGDVTINGQKTEIVVFQNTYKQEGEKTPDWRIYVSEPRANSNPAPKTVAKGKAPAKKPSRPVAEEPDLSNENVDV